jgi:serine phosphatase RsbU (regulator of sigma subunit)
MNSGYHEFPGGGGAQSSQETLMGDGGDIIMEIGEAMRRQEAELEQCRREVKRLRAELELATGLKITGNDLAEEVESSLSPPRT